jgi:hypothetical protein
LALTLKKKKKKIFHVKGQGRVAKEEWTKQSTKEQNFIFPCKMNRLDMNRFNKHLLAEAFLSPILLPIMLNAKEMSYVPQHLAEAFTSTVNGLHLEKLCFAFISCSREAIRRSELLC